jgi:hypothetical protein
MKVIIGVAVLMVFNFDTKELMRFVFSAMMVGDVH